MKKLLFLMLLVSSFTYAHNKTEADKQAMYQTIKLQVEEGKIDLQTAQKMWAAYIRCCKE